MKVLVTSGGTKVPIDDVRSITNTSSGSFGSKIVSSLLVSGQQVHHLHATGSPTPFEFKVDLANARNKDYVTQLDEAHQFAKQYLSSYTEELFTTYDDYASQLESLCKAFQYDVVILCAAVSDYKVENQTAGKISSKDGAVINLVPVDKLISKVKEWIPNTKLVGFKLTSGSTDNELDRLSKESMIKNSCDIVIGNKLEDIQGSCKRVLITKKTSATFVCSDSRGIAGEIAMQITHPEYKG